MKNELYLKSTISAIFYYSELTKIVTIVAVPNSNSIIAI